MMEVKHPNQFTDLDAPWRDAELLEELYVEQGMGTPAIADELGCATSTVHKWLKRAGIETRKFNAEKTPWFGSTQAGYECWRHSTGSDRYSVYVHRLACVVWFGFDAVCGLDVHHKSGVPWDNREENLELLTTAEHASLHHPANNPGGRS